MEESKKKFVDRSFVENGAKIYETIYSSVLGVCGYYYFDRISGENGFTTQLTIGEVTYRCPQNNLAENGLMLFPERAENYVSFVDLLENIRAFIHAYVELPDDYELIASCYVMLTWVFDCFNTIPYLRARGDYGTGKTRFLQVIGSICYRPLFASGATTTSPIFRLNEQYHGLTLILDEADFTYSGADVEIIKILNTGYMKGAGVLRTEGDRVRQPTAFLTYGPKILATRKEFQDLALESRCLTNYMSGMNRKDIPIHLPKAFYYQSQMIRNQLLKFRIDSYKEYEIDPNMKVDGIEPRVNQVIMPLCALVDDEVTREKLRDFAKKHAQTQAVSRSETLEAEVLYTMIQLAKESTYLPVKKIAEKVDSDRNKERGEFIVSPEKIGRINKTSFGFETRRVSGKTEIIWDKEKAEKLCVRFNIKQTVEDVDDVEVLELLNATTHEEECSGATKDIPIL